jgi:hypothetical protein
MDLFFTIPFHFLLLNSISAIHLLQQPAISLQPSASILAIGISVHQQTYSLLTILLSLVSGTVVGFSLGLIGGGGSILAVPLLIYVVGVTDAHIAIGTSALTVGVNALRRVDKPEASKFIEKIKSVIAIKNTRTDLAKASKCSIFDYHTIY